MCAIYAQYKLHSYIIKYTVILCAGYCGYIPHIMAVCCIFFLKMLWLYILYEEMYGTMYPYDSSIETVCYVTDKKINFIN